MHGPRETLVTIPLTEYEELKERDRFLSALEGGGVDNWQGYYESTRDLYGDDEEEDEDDYPDFVDGSP